MTHHKTCLQLPLNKLSVNNKVVVAIPIYHFCDRLLSSNNYGN
jgi:hypothetical protein